MSASIYLMRADCTIIGMQFIKVVIKDLLFAKWENMSDIETHLIRALLHKPF